LGAQKTQSASAMMKESSSSSRSAAVGKREHSARWCRYG
jgi:hypothetical protein